MQPHIFLLFTWGLLSDVKFEDRGGGQKQVLC